MLLSSVVLVRAVEELTRTVRIKAVNFIFANCETISNLWVFGECFANVDDMLKLNRRIYSRVLVDWF